MNTKILLVDDEEHVLSGYTRNLRNHFDIYTATSGEKGLTQIKENGPFAIVVSDFKMPNMNGNQFLAKVKEISPDTVRIMLTGFADLATTIEAVNEGNIFRLLTKPCSNDKLLASLNDAAKQFQLINTEKELLDKTLKGTIRVLIDILAVVNPVAFSKVSRYQKYMPQIIHLLNIENAWEAEVASLLSHIGLVTMPPDLLDKKLKGENLEEEGEKIFFHHPQVGSALLQNIPRFEDIAKVISLQFHPFNNLDKHIIQGEDLPIAARILYVLNKYDIFISEGYNEEEAFKRFKKFEDECDPNVVIALDTAIAGIYQDLTLMTVDIEELEPGVVSAENICDKNNQVLITKGSEITYILKIRLLNYAKLGTISRDIKVLK